MADLNKCVPVADLPNAPHKVHDRKPPESDLSDIRTQGGVLLYEVTIGTSGNVTDTRLLQSTGQRPSARIADLWHDAIQDWTFEPTVIADRAVSVCMTVAITIDVR